MWNRAIILVLLSLLSDSCELLSPESTPVCTIQTPKPVIKLISSKPATRCIQPDGEFTVVAEKGKPPYRFALDQGSIYFTGSFKDLAAGEYRVRVIDANNCEGFLNVKIETGAAVLEAFSSNTEDNTCFSNNGTITVTAKNGKRPFMYQLNDLPFQTDSVFYQLDKGNYKVTVKDASNCSYQFYTTVKHGLTGVSYRNDVQPVLTRNCNMSGCHNGDAGSTINFTQFAIVRFYGSILIRYASMNHRQPPLSQQEIDYIRCWVEDEKPDN